MEKVTYVELSKAEDLARFKAASRRLVQAAKKDKNVALQMLRESGYFDMLAAFEEQDKAIAAAKAHRFKTNGAKVKTPARQPAQPRERSTPSL